MLWSEGPKKPGVKQISL